MEQSEIQTQIERTLISILGATRAHVTVRPAARSAQRGVGPDLSVDITIGASHHYFVVNWCGSRASVSQVRRQAHLHSDPGEPWVVFAAERFSVEAERWLTEAGRSWLAGEGGANIVLPSGLVVVAPQPPPGPSRSRSGLRWTVLVRCVAEYLLDRSSEQQRDVRTDDVASCIGVSQARVSQVLTAFDSRGWTEKHGTRGRGAHRVVCDRSGLLDKFVEAHRSARVVPLVAATTSELDLLRWTERSAPSLHQLFESRWAVTGEVASQLLAPHLTAARTLTLVVEVTPDVPKEQVAEGLGLTLVAEGGRVQIVEAPLSNYLTWSHVDARLPVVGPARVYADLVERGERADEAAALLRQVIVRD